LRLDDQIAVDTHSDLVGTNVTFLNASGS